VSSLRAKRWLAAIAAVVPLLTACGESDQAITHGPRDRRWVALTFDADMTRGMLALLRAGTVRRSFDPEIVSVLERERAAATVFVTGLWAETYPTVLRTLADDPLVELENHSVDHASFQESCFGLPRVRSERQKREEISGAAATISTLAGVRTRYFRFPGGCYDESDLALVRSLGHEPVTWDVLSEDSYEVDPARVARNVLTKVRPGSIVVMHLNGAPNAPATAEALRIVIPELRRRGFRLVTLSELLSAAGG
jgi:peptidoglycan/xylan/chitin deacetylase (PgdA/CDA1 family)